MPTNGLPNLPCNLEKILPDYRELHPDRNPKNAGRVTTWSTLAGKRPNRDECKLIKVEDEPFESLWVNADRLPKVQGDHEGLRLKLFEDLASRAISQDEAQWIFSLSSPGRPPMSSHVSQ